jgi:hypothetical protein
MSQRVKAVVWCPYCAWSAQHLGDSTIEVATFLAARRTEHVINAHRISVGVFDDAHSHRPPITPSDPVVTGF